MFPPTTRQIRVRQVVSSIGLVTCGLLPLFAANAQQPSATPAPESFEWRLYRTGPSFFSTPDPADQSKGWKLNPGVVPLPSGEAGLFDVRSVLERSGVNPSPGAVAIYSQPTGALVIHDTKANVDLTDTISSDGGWVNGPEVMKINLTLIEYALPGGEDWKSPSPLAYAELEKLTAGSIKVLDRMTAAGKSGQILAAEHVANSKSAKPSSAQVASRELFPFTGNETGLRFHLEPTAGPDGHIIDVNLKARFRTPFADGNPKSALSGKVDFSSTVWDGCPVVVQSFRKPGAKGEFVALILQIDFANPGGWKVSTQ